MTITLIFILVVFLLALIFVPFTRQLVKDKEELSRNPINKKFEILVGVINDTMLEGKGEITLFNDDPRLMNLMSEDKRNMLIQFYYSTGNLTITLNYKYLQKELVYKKIFTGLRNLSVFMQRDIANEFIEICSKKITEHQQNVGYTDLKSISGTPNKTLSGMDPMDVVRGMYNELTQRQRCSAINLLYTIAQASGAPEEVILKNIAFNQIILTLNVRWNDCKKQLNTLGENSIYSDLNSLDDSIITMLLLTTFQLVVSLDNNSNSINPIVEKKVIYCFGKIGYSEDKINQEIEKVMLMAKMFS